MVFPESNVPDARAPSVLCVYREAGCTGEFIATVQYHLLKMKTSPVFSLGNHLLGKRGCEKGKERETKTKQIQKELI